MLAFLVYHTFTIKFNNQEFDDVFVTYVRSPNCSGRIYEMSYWAPHCTLYPCKLFLEEEELTSKELNAIHVRAAKLWDDYFAVDNVSCAVDWVKNKMTQLVLKKSSQEMDSTLMK